MSAESDRLRMMARNLGETWDLVLLSPNDRAAIRWALDRIRALEVSGDLLSASLKKADSRSWEAGVRALYAEAERHRDAGNKKKAAVFAEAACYLESVSEPF